MDLNVRPKNERQTSGSGPQFPNLQPLWSPAFEEVPIWNILPSYQLYQSTFSKSISPQTEDPVFDPPRYAPQQPSDGYFPVVNEDVQTPTRWEDSILGNTHRLKRLADIDSQLADQLQITLVLTKNRGARGVPPEVLNHESMEFAQGSSITGYLTVKNTSKVALPYNMFSVVLEGKVSVTGDSPKKPQVFHKFLNMFDFSASWTPVDLEDPEEIDHADFDNMDGTQLSLPVEKYFAVGITYKKFFNFTLPDKLLDCACETHNLARHCEMLPSFGLARDEFLQRARKMRARPHLTPSHSKGHITPVKSSNSLIPSISASLSAPDSKKSAVPAGVPDFSFSDTAISYSIEARVVGKTTDYYELTGKKHKVLAEKREFLIVNHGSLFLRVAPHTRVAPDDSDSQAIYRNLIQRITQKTDLGKELLEIAPKRANSIVKNKQLTSISTNDAHVHEPDSYSVVYPHKKKSLTSAPKVIGMFGLSTPIHTYTMQYTPSRETAQEQTLHIPIDLTYTSSCTPFTKPPEIKSISVELIIVTYRSKKYPIPIEVTEDMVFHNEEDDGLEAQVVNPMKKKLGLLAELMHRVGSGPLNVDNQLIMDMKSIAQLSVKQNVLKFASVKADTPINLNHWESKSTSSYTKTLKIAIDTQKFKDATGDFTLVPNFQSCIIGRTYFLNVIVRLASESYCIKVPLRVEN